MGSSINVTIPVICLPYEWKVAAMEVEVLPQSGGTFRAQQTHVRCLNLMFFFVLYCSLTFHSITCSRQFDCKASTKETTLQYNLNKTEFVLFQCLLLPTLSITIIYCPRVQTHIITEITRSPCDLRFALHDLALSLTLIIHLPWEEKAFVCSNYKKSNNEMLGIYFTSHTKQIIISKEGSKKAMAENSRQRS